MIIAIISLTAIIVLSILTIFNQNQELSKLKNSHAQFLADIDERIKSMEANREAQINEAKDRQLRARLYQKTLRAERVLEIILRELQEEGISSVKHNVVFKSDYITSFKNFDFTGIKSIFFSYDDLKDMLELLMEDGEKFESKYEFKIKYETLVAYIKNHFNNKDTVKEVIKDQIKKGLAKELMDVLTEDEKPVDLEALKSKLMGKGVWTTGMGPGSVSQKVGHATPRKSTTMSQYRKNKVNKMLNDIFSKGHP